MFEWGFQLGEDASCGGVRKMSVARENALLYRPGATEVILQKRFIVVCFDENRANSAERLKNQTGCITKVGKNSKTRSIAGNSKSDGIDSIVGNRECPDGKASNPKLRSRLKEPPVAM